MKQINSSSIFTYQMDTNLGTLRELVKDREEAWCAAVLGSQKVRHDMEIEQQHIQPTPSHGAGPLVKIVKNVLPCVSKALLPQNPTG